MLSAFEAHPLVELKQRDKSKVECVALHDDRLLVGLNTGSLRYYRLNRHEDAATTEGTPAKGERPRDPDHAAPQATKASVDLMREVEKFSKQRIESLAVVEKAALLLSLTNGYVHLHNLQSLEQQEVLSKSKGASFLAVLTNPEIENAQEKSTAGTRRELHAIVAVAVKRRLLIWTVTDQGIDPEPREIVLVSGIKSLTWITQSKLVAGLASIYVLVDVNTSTVTDVVGPGSIGGAPGQDGGRFGGAGVAGMSYLGMTAPPPLSTRLSPGEVLLAKDINTHFIDYDGNALGRRQIPWSLAPDSIGYLNPYLISVQTSKDILEIRNPHTLTLLQSLSLTSVHRLNFHREPRDGGHHNKSFLALSDRVIWNIRPLDFDRQLDDLVDQQQLDEAISLLGLVDESMLDDHDARIKQIKTLKAQALFDKHRFRDAIDLFTDIAAPPERVINLYPPFIAGSESASSAADTRSPTGSQYKREASSTESEHEKSIKSPTRKRSGSNGHLDDSHKSRVPLEDKALKAATEELRGFLVSARNKMKIFLNPDGSLKREGIEDISSPELGALLLKPSFDAASDQEGLLQTARLIDTTLFRAYMFVSPSFAGPLFRIDNFCDPEVVNEKLLEAGRYNDLVDFFHGKKLHQQALELLKKFGDIDQPDNAAPSLAGPQRTVAYLQSLPPELIDLILRFAKWPLRRNPDLAMEIFLADTENAETLSRDRVLDFLQNIDLSLAVKYLEHIIHELNDTTPSFHQRLVETYVQKLKSGQFANDEERHEWNEKTLDFLKTSRNYQAYKALNLMDKDNPHLYEARAVVLSNMGQHRQALDIYVFKLQDPEKAEDYCNQIYLQELNKKPTSASKQHRLLSEINDQSQEATPTIYHDLLSLYLSPPPPYKPQWGPALSILAKHGARIPAGSTLALVPETLPVQELESYFRGRIRAANSVVNEGRIIAGLRGALTFNEDAKLRLGDGLFAGNEGRNRRVVITEDRVCGVCFKRFGGSAVKVMPE